ncbi:EamA family transporter RarD [Hasllibacter sp. MH4015]|uniref:EamA family transporter RarD n=1 Tax=Hasllibacter sp. MH4015 TaxID=2854029 RepID=UPI001CD6E465|nr:EamA family transporter RarD [Hasllibacter sp. MH4015]
MAHPTTNDDTPAGFAYAVSAYVLWGGLPIYLKALSHVPAMEVVAHRVLWSLPIIGLLIWITGRTDDLKTAIRSSAMLGMAAVTAAFISINWGVYIWAIANDRALDGALGYYINPLFSIFLGAVLLGERLSPLQWGAVALAALAVLVLTVEEGRLPWVALALMLSWGGYAFCKRRLPIGPNQGFFLEVAILCLPALVYVAWLGATGQGAFLRGAALDTWLLIGCGLVTAIPLILYVNGAKLLRLSTIGILQYIAPTLIFLVAVFLFEEPFGPARMIAFPMIWGALVLYSIALFRQSRR